MCSLSPSERLDLQLNHIAQFIVRCIHAIASPSEILDYGWKHANKENEVSYVEPENAVGDE